MLAIGALITVITGILFVGLLFAWYAKDLPRPDKVQRKDGLSTVIVDRNGEKLYDVFQNVNRIAVNWEDIPQYLKDATVSIEDKEFYKHKGLSSTGFVRALISTVFLRRMQGGSTLTQQLVKNVLLTNERSLPRKMKEAVLAIQIERSYSKDEILRMYLNEAPYGGTAVGVESAAEEYFGKHVKELGLVECVILAGLPQSPSLYSPFGKDPKAYISRAQSVLRRMREDGKISAFQEAEVRKQLETVVFATGNSSLRAPHFIAYVKELLTEKFGEKLLDAGGLTVTTTLDWTIQEKAQKIVLEEVGKSKTLKVGNGAAVILDAKTSEILGMVGSKDYSATDSSGLKFNVATQGLRQPGSALKPVTYAAALKKGYTASTVLMDVETKYPSGDPAKPEYNPKNYDSKYRGPVGLRNALANSINTVAVKISALVGVRDILSLASDMGITSLAPTDENIRRIGLSLTLGGGEVTLLELTGAYGVFATGGVFHEPVAILKVTDVKGKTLFEHKPTNGKRVLNPEVPYLISDILSDNEARKDVFGLKSYLYIGGHTVAVKTGTTDDKRDNWTVGYTPSVVVGTWVGNNDNTPMHPSLASGMTGAAPIWNRIIREVLKDKPDEPFERPGNIIDMDIDSYGGGLPNGGSIRKERFIKGTEPISIAPIYQSIKVSKRDNNKLANPVEIAKGEYDTKQFIIFSEKDPVSSDGKNRWQEGIDAWTSAQGDSKYHPPRDVYEGSDQIGVSIREISDGQQINSNDVKVRADIGATSDISKWEIQVDGAKVKEGSGANISETININNGNHTISVKATDTKGNSTQADVRVGINQPYSTPTPSPTPTPTPTPLSTPTTTP